MAISNVVPRVRGHGNKGSRLGICTPGVWAHSSLLRLFLGENKLASPQTGQETMRAFRALKKMARVRSRSSRQAPEDAVWNTKEAVARDDESPCCTGYEGGLANTRKRLYMLTT